MFKKEKIKKDKEQRTFKTSEVILLLVITFVISISIGFVISSHSEKTKDKSKDSNLDKFIENYNFIINNYYEDIDKKKLIDNAISGMMEGLDDPYSVYMDENSSSNFNITLDGEYKGLGIQIAKDEEQQKMIVVDVFKDSPADKAGLKSGDIINKLDGKDLKDKTASDFSNSVLNSNKQEFKLTITRDNQEQEIVVTKDNITIDSVTSKTFERNNKKIGYIYISIFANNTSKQFFEQLKKLENDGIDSLIIDVRSNTGGHLTAVEAILNNLLTKDQITYQLSKNKKNIKYYGKAKNNKSYPIALLGDENSASASEILISSIKENLNSKFYGQKTYGKGTVQELVTLTDGKQYKITTKKWLTPKGNWINKTKGIKPDVEIKMDDKYYETLQDEDDNQLQTVLDEISK